MALAWRCFAAARSLAAAGLLPRTPAHWLDTLAPAEPALHAVTLLPALLQLPASSRRASDAAVRELPANEGQPSFASRPSQQAEQGAVYVVDIVTGDVRGAGTEVQGRGACVHALQRKALNVYDRTARVGQAPAIIRLIGSEGQSEEYVLGARLPMAPPQSAVLALTCLHVTCRKSPC